MPQNNAQLRRAAGNAPATIAPMALITTPPRIQIPSSTVTVDVILCEESKAIFNSATECLCSADYSHMIPLLKQITQHTCATQHCQALLFRHVGLGLAHYKMADHHEATKHFMEYRSLALTLARPADISLAHVYLGDISTIKSNYSNAAYHYLEAIHNYGTNNSNLKSRLPVHNSLGNLLQSMGDYTGALQEYKEAVNLGEELNDLVSLGWAHGNLGNAHLGLHQKDAALHHLKKALALTIEHESTPQAISRAYNNLGTAYQSLEDFKGAEENFNLALDQAIYGTMVPSPGYSPTKLYRLGASDLTHAIELCNEVLQSTKGCTQGLSLSVSLIENNSRTFHKLQDCLIGLQQMDEALVVAEQCRARTLGERLLEKMGGGAKLIVWLIIPIYGRVLIDCRVVEVERLEKEKFGGKTFDQYVRQSVQEAVVGNDLELFQDVSGSQISPLTVLFDVVVFPVLDMLGKCKLQHLKNLILIPDSYTSLIPFVALHPEGDFNSTFGSTFSIQMMPSLLVMGILNEAHPTSAVMYNSRTACVVGNPHIPIFEHNDEEWSLGRLPHATDEAKWISQLLKVQPLLHEQATKVAVVTKLSSAQVLIHQMEKPSKSADILLLPSEVEQMNIKAALVVLSSCDSGRGMVRADGIIGMGRAFLLAGAQSILTTLWRIPDESAGMFMQFFYQYLVDGLGTTHALQKATLSIAVVEKLEQGLIQLHHSLAMFKYVTRWILLGYEGTELTDPVKTFIHSFYDYFRGGVFWISCRSEEVAAACVKKALERIVYGHLQKTKCSSPSDEDRVALEILVDITKGSPPVIDIMTSKGMCTKYPESLDAFTPRLIFTLDESEPFSNVIDKQPMKARNCVSFDLWDAINTLADLCELTSYEELFLHCLCIFHNVPVPKCVLEGLSCLIKRSCSQMTSCQEMCQKLVDFNLLKSYPHPVVLPPIGGVNGEVKETPLCYCVLPAVATAIWNGKMNDTDKVMALGIVYRVFEDIYSNRHILSSSEIQHVFGLVCVVLEVCNCICYLIGEECYQLFYLMLERFKNLCNTLL
eukprot:Em0239g1a